MNETPKQFSPVPDSYGLARNHNGPDDLPPKLELLRYAKRWRNLREEIELEEMHERGQEELEAEWDRLGL